MKQDIFLMRAMIDAANEVLNIEGLIERARDTPNALEVTFLSEKIAMALGLKDQTEQTTIQNALLELLRARHRQASLKYDLAKDAYFEHVGSYPTYQVYVPPVAS